MGEQDNRAEIMVVDDSHETLQLLSRMLYKNGYDVRPVSDGQAAINSARQTPPDLALLDISMSGLNGYELCRLLKSEPATQDVPVIFISALDDVRNKVKAFEVGAVDYIPKPFKFEEVLARVEVHLSLSRKAETVVKGLGQEKHGGESIRGVNEESIEFVIHDLRNPLHAISLNLALLKKKIDRTDNQISAQTNEQLDEYFERIERNLALANQIIAQSVEQ